MALKKLIVVRHGCAEGGNLTPSARQQIASLAQMLAVLLNGSSIILLSSPTPRTKETSEILAGHLGGLRFEEYECLWSSGYLSEKETEVVLRLVEEKGKLYDVVILSTHLEIVDIFPTEWGKTRGFQIKKSFDTPKGSARIIDAETGQVEHLQATST